jgi:hypothetical protein
MEYKKQYNCMMQNVVGYIIALSQQQEIKVKLRMLQTSISNVSRRFSTGNDRRYLNKINMAL